MGILGQGSELTLQDGGDIGNSGDGGVVHEQMCVSVRREIERIENRRGISLTRRSVGVDVCNLTGKNHLFLVMSSAMSRSDS